MRTLPAIAFLLLFLTACGGSSGGGDDGGGGGDNPGTVPPPQADTRLNTDTAGSELSLFPAMCCDGPRIYVAWYDRRNGNLDVYFNRSIDGGLTWLATDIRLDSGAAGSAGSLLPVICCSGTNVYVAWYDERNAKPDIYFNRSLDSGATWLASDIRLNTNAAGASASREPAICCDGPRVYVGWHDDRRGNWDIQFNRSLDSGATWLASDVRIDTDAGSGDQQFVQLACAGTNVAAVWNDDREGNSSVYFTRSLNTGTSWEPSDTRLDQNDAAGVPRIAVSGTAIHVVWTDASASRSHIRYNRSTNVGVDWLATPLTVDRGIGSASNPSICATGNDFYVAWEDTRSGSADVYLQRTRDFGATWFGADFKVNANAAGATRSWEPRVCCDQQHVHVVWRDDRAGDFDVFMRYSPNRGDSWSTPEQRLDSGAAGAAQSVAPQVCCNGPFAGIVWMDDRHGGASTTDIYFNRADFAP